MVVVDPSIIELVMTMVPDFTSYGPLRGAVLLSAPARVGNAARAARMRRLVLICDLRRLAIAHVEPWREPRTSERLSDMLAYVLWHWCGREVEMTRYLEALTDFHRALAADPPAGFRGSRVVSVESAPWAPVARALEDWYFVDDFAALGALNEAAVAGRRRAPHDGAARLAAGGKG